MKDSEDHSCIGVLPRLIICSVCLVVGGIQLLMGLVLLGSFFCLLSFSAGVGIYQVIVEERLLENLLVENEHLQRGGYDIF